MLSQITVRAAPGAGQPQITADEFRQAYAALALLPIEDLRLLVAKRIPIELHPVSGLENGILGACAIEKSGGSQSWNPTLIRIAVRAGYTGHQATGEIVQHEVGHVAAVTRTQDLSETTAERYARSY